MATCEKCWRDASAISLNMGTSVSDEYTKLCDERLKNPCTQLEQHGRVECPHCLIVYAYGEFHMCDDDQEGVYPI